MIKIKLNDKKRYNIYLNDAPVEANAPKRWTEYKGITVGVNPDGKGSAYTTDGTTWYQAHIDRYNNRERIDIYTGKGARVRIFVHRLVLFLYGSTSEGFVTYKNGNKYSFKRIQPQTIPLDWKTNKENVILHLDGNPMNNDFKNLTVLKLTEQNIYSTAKNWVTSSWLESIQKIGKDLIVEFKNTSKKGNTIVKINYPNKGVYFKALFNAPSKGKWIWQNLMPKPLGTNDNYKIVGYRKP